MHVMKIIGIVGLSIWAYVFVGVHIMRDELVEDRGMVDRMWVFVTICLWPILPIVISFAKE